MTLNSHRSPHRRSRLAIAAWAAIACLTVVPFAAAETQPSQIQLADEERVELLLTLASDAPMKERVDLLYELATADLTTYEDIVVEVAGSPFDTPLRAASIELLSRLPAERARPTLEKLVDDPNPHVHALAAEALRTLDPPQPASFEKLAAGLDVATEAIDRRALASQLGALEDPRAQELLWSIAADASEDPIVVATAVEGLLIPLDRPDLATRLEALLATHSSKKSSVAATAIRVRLTDPGVVIPGEIVD